MSVTIRRRSKIFPWPSSDECDRDEDKEMSRVVALDIRLGPVKIRALLIPSDGQRAIRLCPLSHAPPETHRCDLGKWSVMGRREGSWPSAYATLTSC